MMIIYFQNLIETSIIILMLFYYICNKKNSNKLIIFKKLIPFSIVLNILIIILIWTKISDSFQMFDITSFAYFCLSTYIFSNIFYGLSLLEV
jgi:hypothetical protein